MTSFLTMSRIMQTVVLDDVDSSQLVLMRVIEYLMLEISTQTMWLHEYVQHTTGSSNTNMVFLTP